MSKVKLDQLSASEALFGFVAWLTTLKKAVTFSAHDEAGIGIELVSEFIGANGLESPRENWTDFLTHPQTREPWSPGEYPETRLAYWFVHDDRSGNIYKSDRFGLVIVFDGLLKIGEEFHIMDVNTKEMIKGEELAKLVELLVSVVSRSIPRG